MAVRRQSDGSVDLRGNVPSPSQVCLFRVLTKPDPFPDKAELARKIMLMRRAGLSFRAIGRELDIHWTRVQQIAKSAR